MSSKNGYLPLGSNYVSNLSQTWGYNLFKSLLHHIVFVLDISVNTLRFNTKFEDSLRTAKVSLRSTFAMLRWGIKNEKTLFFAKILKIFCADFSLKSTFMGKPHFFWKIRNPSKLFNYSRHRESEYCFNIDKSMFLNENTVSLISNSYE